MKKCDKCGYENRDAAKFCNDCGAPLAKRPSADAAPSVCPACGAVAVNGAKFCGVCGRKLDDPAARSTACLECGYVNEKDSEFCGRCGAPLVGEPVAQNTAPSSAPASSAQAPAATAPDGGKASKAGTVKAKTVEFEKKHHVIINAVISVLAIIILFVALFAPIKLRVNVESIVSSTDWSGSSESTGLNDAEYIEIEQRFWHIFGALGYIGLDGTDLEEFDKISEQASEYYRCITDARDEFNRWKETHPYASEHRAREELAECLEDDFSDINFLAGVLAAISERVEWYGPKGSPAAESLRTNTIVTLVQSLITVGLCLAIAIVSLVFLIRALTGMYNKRTSVKLFKFLGTVLILSGVGIFLGMTSPMIDVGGNMMGLALFTAITYIICGAASSVISERGIALTIKRAAISVVLLVAFFVLCGETVKVVAVYRYPTSRTLQYKTLPVGGVLYELINATCAVKYGTYTTNTLFGESVAACVTALLLGVLTAMFAFVAMIKALREFNKTTDKMNGAFAFAITSIVFDILFAVLPVAIGSSAYLQDIMSGDSMLVKLSVSVRAGVYVSLAFAATAVVLCACFKPQKAQSPSVSAA